MSSEMKTHCLKQTPNSEEIVIRRIKASEFKQVFRLAFEAFREEAEIAGFDTRRFRRITRFYRILSNFLILFDFFNVDLETVLVAVSESRLAGMAHLVPHGKNVWSIGSVAVDPLFRRRGIYRRLLQEAINYVAKKDGQRIIQSIHADNVAALKMADELGFRILEERSLFCAEIRENPNEEKKSDVKIRQLRQADIEKVYDICRTRDSKSVEALKVSCDDFREHFSSKLWKRLAHVHSEKWVLDFEDEVEGYASVAYTSPKEAGSIESFYVMPSSSCSDHAALLLQHVLRFLHARGIRKVIVSLNKDWQDVIEVFRDLGFERTFFSYEAVKELASQSESLKQSLPI